MLNRSRRRPNLMLHFASTVALVSSGNLWLHGRAMAQDAVSPPFQITREDVIAVQAAAATKRTYSGTESAGDAAITNNDGDSLQFLDSSTAASATIVNNTGGVTSFENSSTAASALITNNAGGALDFSGASTAANANITNNADGAIRFSGSAGGGQASVTNNGSVTFDNTSGGDRMNIVNNEGAAVTFNDDTNAGRGQVTNNGGIVFNDRSGAGDISLTNNKDATVDFNDTSSAGTAAVANSGTIRFNDQSSAGDSAIVNNKTGAVAFGGNSSAGTAFISNSGSLAFNGNSSAAEADLVNNATGTIAVRDNATLGQAEVNNGGRLEFSGNGSAGAASILTGPAGITLFTGTSSGGTAALETDAGGIVDFSGLTSGKTTVGSIAGPGRYWLGGITLEVGANNRSTTVDGVISDGGLSGGTGGSLVKVGTGTLALGGANTYSGATVLRRGTLQAAAENSFSARSAVEMSAQARLDLAGFDQTIASLSGAGLVDLATATLKLGGNNTNTTYSGVIDGKGGLVKQGGGTFTLSGDSTYTGDTTVTGGRLLVSGSIAASAVSVGKDGILGGTGTVGATTISGTLERANHGTFTVDGDLTFNRGSSYHVTLSPAAGDPLVAVNGTASVEGATLLVSPVGNFSLKETVRFTVLSATNVTGTFSDFDADRPFVDLALFYGPTSIDLDVTRNRNSFASVAQTANQIATANGLESVGDGTLFNTVALVDSDAAARQAFDTLSGELHASLITRLAMEGAVSRRTLLDQASLALDNSREGKGARVWMAPQAAFDDTGGDGNAAGYDWRNNGIVAGADAELAPGWILGAAGGISRGKLDLAARGSSADIDTLAIAAYTAADLYGLRLKAGASHGWNSVDTRRGVTIGDFSDNLSASYDARTAHVFGEVSYPFTVGTTRLEPFGNVAYLRATRDSFAETGGGAALTAEAVTAEGTVTTLGMRAGTEFALADGMIADLQVSAGWRHASLERFGGATRFAGGDWFFVGGVPVDPDALVLGLSAGIDSGPFTLALSYNAEIGDMSKLHMVNGHLNMRF